MSDQPTQPAFSTGTDPERTPSLAPGRARPHTVGTVPARVGHYRVLRVLGEGGMGTVYEAEQEQPKRTVALKVIRAGAMSDESLRRFQHESLVLGRLQHPGIAQVYEAGSVTDEYSRPLPFFAMEFIRGVPLTAYAAQHGLGTRERLDLVARVCDAVYHAHQKGVIHRDLKPANIVVDGAGHPKILDFGVARATDSDIQQTMQTEVGQILGTVPYMSPEQVSGDPSDLDTRSDVYALGVIAFELLAGRLPYELKRGPIHEAARVIKEEEPTRLSNISRALRGDIETIVAKALEKDKVRRYQSAESFASDIRRYLRHEPIAARPASTWYHLARFSRRNRALVGGVAISFALLLAGLASTAWQARIAQRERDAAQAERDEKGKALLLATENERKAREEAERVTRVSNFHGNMLAGVDVRDSGEKLMEDVLRRFNAALDGVPEAERLERTAALKAELARVNTTDTAAAMIDRTILSPAVEAIEEQFKGEPVVDAHLRQVLADRYRDLALYDASMALQRRALETRESVLGRDHPDTLASINNLGVLLFALGKRGEAEAYFRDALEKRRRVMGEGHPDTLDSISNIGSLLQARGERAEAEPYLREALDGSRRVLGEEHHQTVTSIHNMAGLLKDQGRLAESELYFREALEKGRRVLGTDHWLTLSAINNLGSLLLAQGKFDQAEPYCREALENRRRVLGEEHPDTLAAMIHMGDLFQAQGKLSEAEPYFREALEKARRVLGEEHPTTIISINNMGFLLRAQGRLAEAELYYSEALDKCRLALGDEHPHTLASVSNMGGLLRAQGRLAEAEAYYREALEKRRHVLDEGHPSLIMSLGNLGAVLRDQGKLVEAEPYLHAALEKHRRLLGEEHPDTLVSINNMACLLQDQNKLADAESILLPGAAIAQRNLQPRHPITLSLAETIVGLYTAWNKAEPGKGHDVQAAEWKAKLEALTAPEPEPKPDEKR